MWITLLIVLFLFVPYLVLPWYAFLPYLYVMYFAPMPAWLAWDFPFWRVLREHTGFTIVHHDDETRNIDKLQGACVHAIHRHGPFNLGHGMAFIFNKRMKRVWTLYASQLLFVPLMSVFLRARRRATSVNESNIRNLIVQHQQLSLCPGGIREMYLPEHSIIRRTGFLRIVWDLRCPVIPYFSCGENTAYRTRYVLPEWWRQWTMRHFGYEIFHIVSGTPWYFPLAPRLDSSTPLVLAQGPLMRPADFPTFELFCERYYEEVTKLSPDPSHLILLDDNRNEHFALAD